MPFALWSVLNKVMLESILIKNGTLVTVDSSDSIIRGDLLVRGDTIESIGDLSSISAELVIDAAGCAVLPGFVQTHVHLCQTLFRGLADDLPLIDWLKKRIWPLEAAHNEASIRASARLSIAELVKGGTTCAMAMETVHHTEEAFQVAKETGFRATIGKCMMDKGEEVPHGLREETANSIRESIALCARWNGAENGRLRYCFAPRFAVSCTEELLTEVVHLAGEFGVIIHTHASENSTEIQIVESETGLRNIAYLESLGMVGPNVCLAHCVHVDRNEIQTLAQSQTRVLHCPSSNLKLGSGLAQVAEMIEEGILVSLGADGAPCNNRLDMFTEMRTAALLQKVLCGTDVLPARRVLRMATIDGARTLGLSREVGSLEPGKKADIIILDLDALHSNPDTGDLSSTIVYSAQSSDVRTVLVDGELMMVDGRLQSLDEKQVISEANKEAALLIDRAGLSNLHTA